MFIERDEDRMYVAKVPDLPGCATEGKTCKELMINVNEAIRAYLETVKKQNKSSPVRH